MLAKRSVACILSVHPPERCIERKERLIYEDDIPLQLQIRGREI